MGSVRPSGFKIALAVDFLFTYGGAERTLSELCQIWPDAPVYTAFADPEIVRNYFPNTVIRTSSLQNHPLRRWPQLLLNKMPATVESFDLSGFDVVISCSGAFSHGIITGPGTRHICYCLSPMRYAWDYHFSYLKEKGWDRGLKGWFARGVLHRLRLWDSMSASRVDEWIAISEVIRDRIGKYYRQPSRVIYPPVDIDFFDYRKSGSPASGNYAVSVCRLTANKRVDLIIRGCHAAGIPLRIAGSGTDERRLAALANELGASVQFLGRVSDEEKRTLIAGSRCFVFAAEAEDFGIAPVEALALGVPVVAYRGGALPEIVTEGTNGTLFTESTPEGLAEALARLDGMPILDRTGIRNSSLRFGRDRFRAELSSLISDAR